MNKMIRIDKDILLAQTNEAFKKLKRNKKAWQQELVERSEWESLNDGLDRE